LTSRTDQQNRQRRPDEAGVPFGRASADGAPGDAVWGLGPDLPDGAVPSAVAAPPSNEGRGAAPAREHVGGSAVEPEPRDLLRPAVALRHAVVIALGTIVAAAAAAVAAAWLVVPLHGARSEILIDTRGVDWSSADRFLATQALVATSHSIVGPVATAADVPLEELGARLSVQVVGQSSVLRLQYHDADKARALTVLSDLTSRYLAALRELERTAGTSHVILTPPYLLERPVTPRPLRSAALGAVAGFGVTASSLVVGAWLRNRR
jgi:hypothetical protein